MILKDCSILKQYAAFHLHPERPVETVDPTASARCYFNRPSAPQQESIEDAEERIRTLKDCQVLRNCAANYLLPEFLAAHALGREEVLADVKALKMYAKFHLHPELPVETTDAFACERKFFDRPSAPERESREEADEHHQILEDARQLEDWVQLQQFGRVLETDYFHSDYGEESIEDDETAGEPTEVDRQEALTDIAALKMYAKFHLHPELPVETTDPLACGRNFFDRPSALERESREEADEHHQILEDARQLEDWVQLQQFGRVLETDFFHSNDTINAIEYDEVITEADREEVLADVAALKMYAKFHLHPELPVETTDSLACERNFFDRPSAPERETQEEAEEHHQILEDARHLEDLVQLQQFGHVLDADYFHCTFAMDDDDVVGMLDEATTDATAEDREQALADVEALKMYAKFHLHPELPVETTDPLACGRNFFDRPSALERESREEADEHHQILEDARQLEDLVQLQHFGCVLENDYFHCNFAMDEEHAPAMAVSKQADGEGNLSTSPSSILQFV